MKQIEKTSDIVKLLEAADVDVHDDIVVYEAAAFNTLPVRKRQPLYNGAVANRSLLVEMSTQLEKESLPVHIMHNSGALPIGRVFSSKVVDLVDRSELRVLFFIDSKDERARDIDLGIVDQVSVSILPKEMHCSECGFNFLGKDADFDNIWLGECDKGHVIGKNGVHGRMIGLDSWFEMSLVGRGGAQKARIIDPANSAFRSEPMQRLAASGIAPNALVLTATTNEGRIMELNLSEHIEKMAEIKVELTSTKAALETSTARVAELEAALAEATAKLETSASAEAATAAIAEKDAEIAALKETHNGTVTEKDSAVAALQDAAKKILTLTGQVDAEVPATVAELSALIAERETALKGLVATGGVSVDAVSGRKAESTMSVTAFQSRKHTR